MLQQAVGSPIVILRLAGPLPELALQHVHLALICLQHTRWCEGRLTLDLQGDTAPVVAPRGKLHAQS